MRNGVCGELTKHPEQPEANHGNKFEQLGTTAHAERIPHCPAAPGPKYWQQRCDYDITCSLDETKPRLTGSEKLPITTTHQMSLPTLVTIRREPAQRVNNSGYQASSTMQNNVDVSTIDMMLDKKQITVMKRPDNKMTDASGKPLKYTINKTMMRVELPVAL